MLALLLQSALPASVNAQAASRAEYEACQARDETSFRAAIEALTIKALEKGLAGMDYKPLVAEAWSRNDVDLVMTRRIDEAIDELRQETGWLALIESLASKDAAEKLATSTAERVFQRSEKMRAAIEGIATFVGRDVGKRIELATADAAEPATQCLRAFLGPRYGATVAGVVSQDASRQFIIDPSKAAAQISTGQVLVEGSEGLTGAVILLVRRQLSNMAARVGQRLVGAVLGRVVSIVAGGVGVVLIAKDIWELRHGVLPIIATEMKSPATREKVQEELARAMSEQMTEHVRDIGAKAADRVVEIWLDFRRAHAQVLSLAEKNENFRLFLDTDQTRQPRPPGRNHRAGSGKRERDRRPETPRRWHLARSHRETARRCVRYCARCALTGDAPSNGRTLRASSLPQSDRERDPPAQPARRVYEGQPRPHPHAAGSRGHQPAGWPQGHRARRRFWSSMTTTCGVWHARSPRPSSKSLSGYMTGLERSAGNRLLSAVAQSPAKMQILASSGVRTAILQSQDQAAAVGMMLRSDALFEPGDFATDLSLVRGGKVSPWLLWSRYPGALSVMGCLGFFILLLLMRVMFGRRRVAR